MKAINELIDQEIKTYTEKKEKFHKRLNELKLKRGHKHVGLSEYFLTRIKDCNDHIKFLIALQQDELVEEYSFMHIGIHKVFDPVYFSS